MTLTVDVYDTRAAQLASNQAYLIALSAVLWIVSNEVLFNELFADSPSVFTPCRTNLLLEGCETDQAPSSLPDGPNSVLLDIMRSASSVVALGLVWQSICYHMNRHLATTANLAPLARTPRGAIAVLQSPWLTIKACFGYPHSLMWRWPTVVSIAVECGLLALHVPPRIEQLALNADPQAGEAAALRTAATLQLFVSVAIALRLVLIVRAVYFARSDLVRPSGQFIRRFIELPGSPQLFMVKATFRERPVESTVGVFAVVFFFVSYVLRLFETYTCAMFSVHPALITEGAQSAPAVALGAIAGVVYHDNSQSSDPPDMLCAPLELGDSAWLVLISSLTVGYGDVSAETHYGRAVSLAGTLLGILLTGVTIAAVIGFLRLSFPEQAVGQLLARAGSDKRFKHSAAVAIQATWRHFYAEHSFLTWVAGAGGSIAVRPVSGRLPLEIAARRAVFEWRQLRRRARLANMNLNPILQRHIRTQNLLVKVEDLRAEVEELLEEAGTPALKDSVRRILQYQYDMDPARQLSAPMQVLSQAVSRVGAAAAAHKRALSNGSAGGSSPGQDRGIYTTASDGGTAASGPTKPIPPLLGALGKSVSGFQSAASLELSSSLLSPAPPRSKPVLQIGVDDLLRQLKSISTQVGRLQAATTRLAAAAPPAAASAPKAPPSPEGFSVFTFRSPTTGGGGAKGVEGGLESSLSPPAPRDAKRKLARDTAPPGDSKSVPTTRLEQRDRTASKAKQPPPRRPAPPAPKRKPGPPAGAASTLRADTPPSKTTKGGWVVK